MALPLSEFLDRFGVKLLAFGQAGIEPGDLLKKVKEGYSEVGNARTYLGSSNDYINKIVAGNVINGEIQESRKFGGQASLPLLGGVKLKGGLGSVKSVVITITEVESRVFDTERGARYAQDIEADLVRFKKTNKDIWKAHLNDKYFTYECWYAKKFVATLTGSKDFDFGASVKTIEVDGTAKWTNKNDLEVVSNPSVPFGVRADKL